MIDLTKIKWKNIEGKYRFSEYGHLWSEEEQVILPVFYNKNFIPFVNMDGSYVNVRNLLINFFNKSLEKFYWKKIK